MNQPLSRKQIGKLGQELAVRIITPDSGWWPIYETYLNRCEELREQIQKRVEECLKDRLVSISGRTKTRDTLRDKLIKNPTIKLGSIDDVIGIRVVGDFTLSQQDEISRLLEAEFAPIHKVKDRREVPVKGYRALHVIIKAEEMHAEIQIRTSLQSQWADLFERTADTWGRQIRYGLPPNFDSEEMRVDRERTIQKMIDLSLKFITIVENHSRDREKWDSDSDLAVYRKSVPTKLEVKGMSKKELREAYEARQAYERIAKARAERIRLRAEIVRLVTDIRVSVDAILVDLADQVD